MLKLESPKKLKLAQTDFLCRDLTAAFIFSLQLLLLARSLATLFGADLYLVCQLASCLKMGISQFLFFIPTPPNTGCDFREGRLVLAQMKGHIYYYIRLLRSSSSFGCLDSGIGRTDKLGCPNHLGSSTFRKGPRLPELHTYVASYL